MFNLTDSLIVMNGALAYGSALVANRSFEAGETIARFDDAPFAEQSDLTVQVGPGQHVQLDALSHLNHSCRPNTAVDTAARTVTATRDIEPGEILNYFYPSTEWEMERPFVCQCGAPDCVKMVAGARYLSPETLSRCDVNLHVIRAINTVLQSPSMRRPIRAKAPQATAAMVEAVPAIPAYPEFTNTVQFAVAA